MQRVVEVDADDAALVARRCAHWCVSTPSPQPTSSKDGGSASPNSSSSVPSKAAMKRRTTGLVEPYLS